MTSSNRGHQAELIAAAYLQRQGYQVRDLNWQTPECEIDIVALKNEVAFLVEVKYRSSTSQGSGFDYITSSKLKQMIRASSIWASKVSWSGPIQLAAIELTGVDYQVSQFIENIEI